MSTSPPSYAPTSTTSYAPASNENHIKYHQEITKSSILKLSQHKSVYDSLAEVYSIVTVLEMIENSFLKDFIMEKDKYTSTVLRLLNQYLIILKTFENGAGSDNGTSGILDSILVGRLPDNSNFLKLFVAKFNLQKCNLSVQRLEAGIPATIEHLGMQVQSSSSATASSGSDKRSARLVAEVTGNFITCMDALKLNYKSKEQLHPLLSNLVVSLNDLVMAKASSSSSALGGSDSTHPTSLEFVGKSKLVSWLIKLNGFDQGQALNQDEIDSFLNDLDIAYKGFYTSLED